MDTVPDAHAADIALLFHVNTSSMPFLRGSMWRWTDAESRFSAEWVKYVASFSASGVPEGVAVWPRYNQSTEAALVVGAQMNAEEHYLSSKCSFHDSIHSDWVHPSDEVRILYS